MVDHSRHCSNNLPSNRGTTSHHHAHVLDETEIFSPLSDEERARLADSCSTIAYEAGRVFYTPDDTGEIIFILKSGKVDLYRLTMDGKKIILASLKPNALFGNMGLIGQRMYRCFAEAAEDCVLWTMSRDVLIDVIRRNPDVGLLMLAEMERRLLARETDLEIMSFQSLTSRLAAYLLHETDEHGVLIGSSHQDIADHLATYRETISEILGRFRKVGLVSTGTRRIQIVDRHGLAKYAHLADKQPPTSRIM